MRLRVLAHAKINLYLDVLGRMPDRYHSIHTVFQSVSLCDEIFARGAKAGVKIAMRPDLGISFRENLAWRAAVVGRKSAQRIWGRSDRPILGISLEISKRIPAGAGLAGGSADAAGTLACVQRMNRIPRNEVLNIAADLGADVSACLVGGTLFGRGRGEILSPMERAPKIRVVVVGPPLSISTAWAYRELRAGKVSRRGSDSHLGLQRELSGLIQKGSWKEVLYNAFEKPVFRAYPNLRSLKNGMLSHGACAALMSGTGSSIYAVPEDREAEAHLMKWLSGKSDLRVFRTSFVRKGVSIRERAGI